MLGYAFLERYVFGALPVSRDAEHAEQVLHHVRCDEREVRHSTDGVHERDHELDWMVPRHVLNKYTQYNLQILRGT
jgi:hypothetical protein